MEIFGFKMASLWTILGVCYLACSTYLLGRDMHFYVRTGVPKCCIVITFLFYPLFELVYYMTVLTEWIDMKLHLTFWFFWFFRKDTLRKRWMLTSDEKRLWDIRCNRVESGDVSRYDRWMYNLIKVRILRILTVRDENKDDQNYLNGLFVDVDDDGKFSPDNRDYGF